MNTNDTIIITTTDEIIVTEQQTEVIIINDGFKGEKGDQGTPGQGVAPDGTIGQILAKKSDLDYDTKWIDVSAGVSFNQDFVIGDWILSAGRYYITFNHDFNSNNTIAEIKEGKNVVYLDNVENFTVNSIRIYVPYNPDCRFSGSITIKL